MLLNEGFGFQEASARARLWVRCRGTQSPPGDAGAGGGARGHGGGGAAAKSCGKHRPQWGGRPGKGQEDSPQTPTTEPKVGNKGPTSRSGDGPECPRGSGEGGGAGLRAGSEGGAPSRRSSESCDARWSGCEPAGTVLPKPEPEAGSGRARPAPPLPAPRGHTRDTRALAQLGACWASGLRTVRGPVSRWGHCECAV